IAHQRRRWFLLVSRNNQPHDFVLAQRRSCDTEGSLIESNASSAMRLSGSDALLASSRQCILGHHAAQLSPAEKLDDTVQINSVSSLCRDHADGVDEKRNQTRPTCVLDW